ncbi:serine hydrolase domain-containing protein [Minwuia thermotolerans]|uniref:Serine hydrolase n=1 Tax=Minwuia thermotolerans TaxID=2056226 RepID=A0A2M9G1U8_9PROT|nr:serine hydrolase domain-containing protein [Minwuia thermotolerans]PJK29689.1 serine hydrolase [Minwuia thermotolerans]
MHLARTGPWKLRAIAAGIAAATLWPAATNAAEDLAGAVDAVIERWIASERIAGVVALAARDGETVYRRAAGWADREAATPVREDTIFRLASMSKLIVAVTAMAMIDREKLALQDTVAQWLPWFRPALPDGRRPAITVRHLLTHTSGLAYGFLEPGGNPYEQLQVPQGLEVWQGHLESALRRLVEAPLLHEPGTAWRYSLSTDVLGAVVEKAAGMPLPEVVARYVTGPLGMSDTAFHVVDPVRLAVPYRDGPGRAERMADGGDTIPLGDGIAFAPARALDPNAYPSGGASMNGTAGDYLILLETLRRGGGPILSETSARLLSTHAIGELRAWTEGEGWGHGLGAAVLLDPEAAETPQNPGTWQWGGVLGGHWFVDPVAKLSVVVLTNTSTAGVIGDFPAEIREALYGAGRN